MAVLEQILNMKKQGIPDQEIINELSQRGISPREINDGLKQAQIKNAVSDYGDEMQPSIMPEGEYIPTPADNSGQEYAPGSQEETYSPQEQQQYYIPDNSGAGYPSAGINADTMMEIADQVFSEKTKKILKQLDATSEAAIILQTKTENISERLRKIEMIIDKLQIAILEKVGSYGQNLESIKKEMSMMQDSFSKMVSPSREIRREEYQEEKIPETQKRISKKR